MDKRPSRMLWKKRALKKWVTRPHTSFVWGGARVLLQASRKCLMEVPQAQSLSVAPVQATENHNRKNHDILLLAELQKTSPLIFLHSPVYLPNILKSQFSSPNSPWTTHIIPFCPLISSSVHASLFIPSKNSFFPFSLYRANPYIEDLAV